MAIRQNENYNKDEEEKEKLKEKIRGEIVKTNLQK